MRQGERKNGERLRSPKYEVDFAFEVEKPMIAGVILTFAAFAILGIGIVIGYIWRSNQ